MSMSGKVAFVTGAAQGLGKAFSEVLLKRGARVLISDVQVQTGESTVSDFNRQYGDDRASFIRCDVTKEADVESAFAELKRRYGRLDVMINNAGIADESAWSKMVDINLKGVILGTQLAVDVMRRDRGGNGGLIVNVASMAGLMAVYAIPSYVATKHAVVGYTKSWALNPYLSSMGLSFACMCPAFANTQIIEGMDEGKSLYSEDAMKLVKTLGVMPVSRVTKAFERLLDTPNNNGSIVTLSKHEDTQIIPLSTSKL